ncbi:hypothetical protein IFM89_037607 [Coptis chinensis]|uniref:Carrier domain-containing protein n=1 Tax=Coptis chinensis TaxID=261450 RepID=A0A835LGY4_9MAGN|nr:hypothetical protein IFM89_037607 [Coptis chinensis]
MWMRKMMTSMSDLWFGGVDNLGVGGLVLRWDEVTPNAHFRITLDLSLFVEIVMALEEEFGFEIPDNEADKINSIGLAVDFIASHPQAK